MGWSQNELARRAEVNHPTLFKIEADQRLNPSVSVIVRIARALGTSAERLYGLESDEARLLIEANKMSMLIEVRPLGRRTGEAARTRAQSFVTAALERAGARVREAAPIDDEDVMESPSPAQAGELARGGLALVDELGALRRRVDALEGWRRTQEGRARKRGAR